MVSQVLVDVDPHRPVQLEGALLHRLMFLAPCHRQLLKQRVRPIRTLI